MSFDTFLTKSTRRTENHESLLYQYRPRTAFTEKLPKHKFPVIWNTIDQNIRTIKFRSSFKKKYKLYLMKKYSGLNVPICNNPRCPDCHPQN